MFCKNCGAQNDDDSLYCCSCGLTMLDLIKEPAKERPEAPFYTGEKDELLFSTKPGNGLNIFLIATGAAGAVFVLPVILLVLGIVNLKKNKEMFLNVYNYRVSGFGTCEEQPKEFDCAIRRISSASSFGKNILITADGLDFLFKARDDSDAAQAVSLIRYRKDSNRGEM